MEKKIKILQEQNESVYRSLKGLTEIADLHTQTLNKHTDYINLVYDKVSNQRSLCIASFVLSIAAFAFSLTFYLMSIL